MAVPIIGVSTFVKLVSLPTSDQIRHIDQYERPGGYDRYRAFKDGAKGYIVGDSLEDVVRVRLNSLQNQSEQEDSLELFDKVVEWRKKNKHPAFIPSQAIWRAPKKSFSVRVEPEIGIQTNKYMFMLSLYCHKMIRPTPTHAAAGIILMRQALEGKIPSNARLGILDIVGGKRFLAVSDFAEKVFQSQVSFLEGEFTRVRSEAA